MPRLRLDNTTPSGDALIEALHHRLHAIYGNGGHALDNTVGGPPVYTITGPRNAAELRADLDATGIVWQDLATVLDE